MKPKSFLIVHWEDPASFDGWTDVDAASAKKPCLVYSIGWAFKEDEHYVYLALDFSEDQHVNTVGKIPKSVIKNIREVKFRGFPKRKEVQNLPETKAPE